MMCYIWWIVLFHNVFIACSGKSGPSEKPLHGYCKTKGCRTKDNERKPAQSGYDGYCKSCYKAKHPKLYAGKAQARQRKCSFCSTVKEVLGNGFCKPCTRARSCATCSAVNKDRAAPACFRCNARRKRLGVAQDVLALWCIACTTVEERACGMCRACYDDSRREACHHCGERENMQLEDHRCAESSCKATFR